MADRVHRVTMFKLPNKEDQEKIIEQYKILNEKQSKDGKPYILSMVCGTPEEDARTQGFTLVAKSEFASLEDLKYYDAECPAHDGLRQVVKVLKAENKVEGMLTVFFKPAVMGGIDNISKA